MHAFLARLKERKVIRATGVYAVSGYAIFQIANNSSAGQAVPRIAAGGEKSIAVLPFVNRFATGVPATG
jgi:hypothetical protein